MITIKDAKELIKIARDAISEKAFELPKKKKFLEKKAVFVTLHTYPEKELRGCIGYSEPYFPFAQAVYTAAKSAAFADPRFNMLQKSELSKVIIELSILSPPKLIPVSKPEEYPKKITPNKDGLILKNGPFVGLFLPQVWEQIHDKENFLDNLCLKAGLAPGSWMLKGVKLYKFKVVAFEEEVPNGKIRKL